MSRAREWRNSVSRFYAGHRTYFSKFVNVLNYHSVKRPRRNSRESFDPPKDIPCGRTSRELVSVISNEWLEEWELSNEITHLDSSSIPIHCIINMDQIKALYNPVVGVNIMSMSLQNI